jgi:hypothetical protein
MDPRLIQQHTTLAEAEARNSANPRARRLGQIIYATADKAFYTYVGPGTVIGGQTAPSTGWMPLTQALIAGGSAAWGKTTDLMPAQAFRASIDPNQETTKTKTIFSKTYTMPTHPIRPGGSWQASLWGTVRLVYSQGQFRVRGYIGSDLVLTEVFHLGDEEGSAKSHVTPVGISTSVFREGTSVVFKLVAEEVSDSGSNVMKVDDAPSWAEAMIWPAH